MLHRTLEIGWLGQDREGGGTSCQVGLELGQERRAHGEGAQRRGGLLVLGDDRATVFQGILAQGRFEGTRLLKPRASWLPRNHQARHPDQFGDQHPLEVGAGTETCSLDQGLWIRKAAHDQPSTR